MRILIVVIGLLLAACSTTVDFAVAPGATIQVRDSSGASQLNPGDRAYEEMTSWIARNQQGWSQLYATNPAGGISASSGQWCLQFFGSAAYLNTKDGMLIKEIKESDYAFLSLQTGT